MRAWFVEDRLEEFSLAPLDSAGEVCSMVERTARSRCFSSGAPMLQGAEGCPQVGLRVKVLNYRAREGRLFTRRYDGVS